jgi:hypothetical protein
MSCENEIIEINLSKVTEVIEVSYEACEHVVNINSAEGIDPADYDLADFQNGNTNYFIQLDQFVDGLDGKVDKVVGETLIPISELDKLATIENGAQVNIIEEVQVNGVALVVGVDKSVNIIVPFSNVLINTAKKNQGVYFDSVSGLWKNEYRWEYLALNGKTDGVEHAATGGYYMEYSLHGNTIYRFITTNEDANGYPLEDSFYSTVSGGVLSNLIVRRS